MKLFKCVFAKESIEYVGHIILGSGVAPNQIKIDAMVNWPVPTNLKQLLRFFKSTGFCRRFINKYASIAYQLIELLRKDALSWDFKA